MASGSRANVSYIKIIFKQLSYRFNFCYLNKSRTCQKGYLNRIHAQAFRTQLLISTQTVVNFLRVVLQRINGLPVYTVRTCPYKLNALPLEDNIQAFLVSKCIRVKADQISLELHRSNVIISTKI